MESERQKFEAAVKASGPGGDLSIINDKRLMRDGEYHSLRMQGRWEGWQMRAKASLSAEQVLAIEDAIYAMERAATEEIASAGRWDAAGEPMLAMSATHAADTLDDRANILRALVTPTNPADTERKE